MAVICLSVCIVCQDIYQSWYEKAGSVVHLKNCAYVVAKSLSKLLQTTPSSYQLRSSCCASASSYRVRGLSLPTELPATEKVLSFADALAGIAKS
jgi:hypothetical protein